MASFNKSFALNALTKEFKRLQEEPEEGFRVKLVSEKDLFKWEVAIFGPPKTLYEGGYFKAHMSFPSDYPYNPPSMKFLSDVWHPNVYKNGNLCISILESPGEIHSKSLIEECWNPTQNVRSIVLSVISLLNEPNICSPANSDAASLYRRWKESGGADNEYENIIREQVLATKAEAAKDNVIVPTTLEEYCAKPTAKSPEPDTDIDIFDDDVFFFDSVEDEEDYDNENAENGET